eukprot:4722226-Lingulodinium_polyedra.AAC.1
MTVPLPRSLTEEARLSSNSGAKKTMQCSVEGIEVFPAAFCARRETCRHKTVPGCQVCSRCRPAPPPSG